MVSSISSTLKHIHSVSYVSLFFFILIWIDITALVFIKNNGKTWDETQIHIWSVYLD